MGAVRPQKRQEAVRVALTGLSIISPNPISETWRFGLELTVSRARLRLVAVAASTGASRAPSTPIDVLTYEMNGVYGFGHGRIRGTMGLGVGAMTLHPFVPGVATEADTRFVANITLGGKYYLSERVAVRADARFPT